MNTVKCILLNVLHALAYLHEQIIGHCDGKPNKRLVMDHTLSMDYVVLSDFGHAFPREWATMNASVHCMTLRLNCCLDDRTMRK
jgi:serine/threonine protein kinase